MALVGALVGAIALPIAASGQSIPAKGTTATFEVGSWNIEFFGGAGGPSNDNQQIANVTEAIRASNLDVWALQEIADEADFNSMVADLGSDFGGVIAPTSSAQGLGLAYVYRKDTVRLRSAKEILQQFSTGQGNPFAYRPPFQLEADVVLPDTVVTVTLINLHMKAQSDLDSYNRRVEASTRLKNNIDFTLLASRPVLILGDFNDLLLGSIRVGQDSPYKNFVDDVGNYSTPTLQLQLDDRSTFCGSSRTCNGSTIDHIVVSNEVSPWYVSGSADHYDELLSAISDYVFTTSDHLPVFALFDIATGVGVEEQPLRDRRQDAVAVNAYPNPFHDRITAEVTVSRPQVVDVALYDVAGRQVATRTNELLTQGVHRLDVDTHSLAAGVYLLVVRTDEKTVSTLVASTRPW